MAIKLNKEFNGVVFAPRREEIKPGPGVLYPRVMELQHAGEANGTLLATFESYKQTEPAVIPIYKSTDGGKTWAHLSDVSDTKNGWGMRFQPMLFELPQPCGDLPEGAILFAGNSIPMQAFEKGNPPDFVGTELQLYVSLDCGETWTYRSSFAYGGVPVEYNWDCMGPVWEPFLYLNGYGELTAVFSDEKPHTGRVLNQCLAVVSSPDGGRTWNEQHLVVAIPDGIKRPGMAIVTKLPNGKYFMCYEIVNTPDEGIHFKLSDDGMDFGDPASYGTRAETADGAYVGSMPYCVWTSNGGPNGAIILSGKRDSGWLGLRDPGKFLVNYNLGEGPWEQADMLVSYDSRIHQAGWSMGMAVIAHDTKLIQLAPVQMDPTLLQISYGIASIEIVE